MDDIDDHADCPCRDIVYVEFAASETTVTLSMSSNSITVLCIDSGTMGYSRDAKSSRAANACTSSASSDKGSMVYPGGAVATTLGFC